MNQMAGWLSPSGDYYRLPSSCRHDQIAGQLVQESFPDQHSRDNIQNQYVLMEHGWIRLDIEKHLIRKGKLPTKKQQITLELMDGLDFKLFFV